MNFSIHLINQNNKASYKTQGYDLERIEDGIMHQELKDSLICGICLGNIYDDYMFRNSARPDGMRQLSQTVLQEMHLPLGKELSVPMPRIFAS